MDIDSTEGSETMTLSLTFIYSFSQFLLSANNQVPDTVVDSGDTPWLTEPEESFPHRVQSSKRNRQLTKQVNK